MSRDECLCGAWRLARREDLGAVEAFLRAREAAVAGLTGRMLRGGRLKLPNPLRGGLYMRDAVGGSRHRLGDDADLWAGNRDAALEGLFFASPTRVAFPVFPCEAAVERGLSELVAARGYAPASLVGLASDVERCEAALGLRPLVRVGYRLMSRPAHPCTGSRARRGADKGGDPSQLSIRRATATDLDALLPLQEAYEHEEVLTAIHRFNAAASRAALARNLEDQVLVVAELSGLLIGKAGTNARAFSLDQVGGVYVAPPYRRQGVARALMEALLDMLAAEGRGTSLFVKPHNAAARALYEGLGYEELADFRADYFSA